MTNCRLDPIVSEIDRLLLPLIEPLFRIRFAAETSEQPANNVYSQQLTRAVILCRMAWLRVLERFAEQNSFIIRLADIDESMLTTAVRSADVCRLMPVRSPLTVDDFINVLRDLRRYLSAGQVLPSAVIRYLEAKDYIVL
jgi:hypothetical protein